MCCPRQEREEHAGDELSATRKLQALLPSACEDSCTLKFDLRTGAIGPAILQAARENKANLIVMGAPHQSAPGRPFAEDKTCNGDSRSALSGAPGTGSLLLIRFNG